MELVVDFGADAGVFGFSSSLKASHESKTGSSSCSSSSQDTGALLLLTLISKSSSSDRIYCIRIILYGRRAWKGNAKQKCVSNDNQKMKKNIIGRKMK